MSQFIIHEFAPLCLSIDRIGPFQERLEVIDFTDNDNEACNLFLFLSQNGRGKTTALELMLKLMSMLGYLQAHLLATANGKPTSQLFDAEYLDSGNGRAQWDVLIRYSLDGKENTVVLSLIGGQIGVDTSLRLWDDDALALVRARQWHRFGFCRDAANQWHVIGANDQWVIDFNTEIGLARGEKLDGFEESGMSLPTLIYFSAYRNIRPIASQQQRTISAPNDWNYRPVHAFRDSGFDWRDSLDNLLVWLKWLDDGRFERALSLVNERVFDGSSANRVKGISKEPPGAVVERDGNIHRLDQLSSGEKSLVQIFLRLGAHMTRNTILLIDEPEAHLHENWKYRLFEQLKQLARDYFPGMTVIVATHSQEVITSFAYELTEENLRKGGYFFETAEEEEKALRIQKEALQRAETNHGNLQATE